MITAFLCFAAGLLSFISPCVLPLVPGFLAFVSGENVPGRHGRTVFGSILFVCGFSLVFATGALLLSFGHSFISFPPRPLQVASGLLIIFFGLSYIGWVPLLNNVRAFAWKPSRGLAGAPMLGAIFALGWSPCIGPTLGAAMALAAPLGAADARSVIGGVGLIVLYCAGLGLPFVLMATGWARVINVSTFLKRNALWVKRGGGSLLVLVGILVASGKWADLTVMLQISLTDYELPFGL